MAGKAPQTQSGDDVQLSRPQSLASLDVHDELPPYEDPGSADDKNLPTSAAAVTDAQPASSTRATTTTKKEVKKESFPLDRKQHPGRESQSNQAQQQVQAEAPSQSEPPSRPELRPTATSPFQFPTTADPPSYTEAEPINRPLALPQLEPSPAAPFFIAYPPALLAYGVASESWCGFVATVSDFLSANVSKQAIHHAMDIGYSLGENSRQFIAEDATARVKGIGNEARRGNLGGVVGGILGLNHAAVGHIVGTVFSLPGHLTKRPQTPRARAEAYAATANQEWFHARGLHAQLLDTSELASLAGVSHSAFLGSVNTHFDSTPLEQLGALRQYIGSLEAPSTSESRSGPPIAGPSSSSGKSKNPPLRLATSTLWLVLTKDGKK